MRKLIFGGCVGVVALAAVNLSSLTKSPNLDILLSQVEALSDQESNNNGSGMFFYEHLLSKGPVNVPCTKASMPMEMWRMVQTAQVSVQDGPLFKLRVLKNCVKRREMDVRHIVAGRPDFQSAILIIL